MTFPGRARDRNTVLGRLGPTEDAFQEEGLFVRLGHRPHGSLQASRHWQARKLPKASHRQAPRGTPKININQKIIEARACRARACHLSCRAYQDRKEKGPSREWRIGLVCIRHRTAADKERDTSFPSSFQAPADPEVGRIGNLLEFVHYSKAVEERPREPNLLRTCWGEGVSDSCGLID